MHQFALKPKTFSNSFGHMLASHADCHGCLVVSACFKSASSRASFLEVQNYECQRYTVKTRKPPLTFAHDWTILPSLPVTESVAPSSAPTTATKTPPYVCFRSSLLALSSVILAVSAANLHPSLASLLNCSCISSFLNLCSTPKKISHFHSYFSVLQADPLSKVHINTLVSFSISVVSSLFGCIHLCEISSALLHSFTCNSCCILVNASVLLCGPSGAALTLSQFRPTIRKRKSHFPNFANARVDLWCLSLLLLSFSFLPFFSPNNDGLMNFTFLYFTFFFFFFSLFFHFSSFRFS